MDLKNVLKKTKKRSEKIKNERSRPSIATEDRPYSSLEAAETKKATKWQQSGNKVATKWQQSGNKVATNVVFSSLVGMQRNIVIFFYNICKTSRSKITDALTLEHISSCLQSSTGAIRTTIQRLEKKGYVKRIEYKNGRGGWSKYELPEDIYNELLHTETGNKLATNWQQSGNKVATELATELATTPSSSSSSIYNINKTTTTSTLPIEWLKIDIDPLNEINLSNHHIEQIYKKGILTHEMVQNSIYAFAYDLRVNNKNEKINKSPMDYFLGILLKKNTPYTPPKNYEDPKDEALRVYLEKQRIIEKQRKEREKEAFELAFNDWYSNTSNDELKRSIQNIQINKFGRESPFVFNIAKDYYRKTFWSQKYEEILKNLKKERINTETN